MALGRLLPVLVVVLIGCATAQAKRVKGYSVTPGIVTMQLEVDSIDFRSDVTRLYGKLKSRPHTSNRIDALQLTVGNRTYECTDIDGVDMQRWFQWEDEGVIPIELDFAPMKSTNGVMTLTATGPRGGSVWKVQHTSANQKHKRK